MATARADAWEDNGLRAQRPPLAARRTPPPPLPPLPDLPGRSRAAAPPVGFQERSADRGPSDRFREDRARATGGLRDDLHRSRPPAARQMPEADLDFARGADRYDDDYEDDLPRSRYRDDADVRSRRSAGERPVAPPDGSRLRGIVAVLAIFLVTLAGGAADSFLGAGLGLITLVALVASTSVATLLVRRRDLVTVVLSPPLVFVAVAGANIALAPSATLNLATVATLLIRGFPTMVAAAGAAVLLAVVRLVTKR